MSDMQTKIAETPVFSGITADAVVARYIELRDYVNAEKKAFNERMKDYTDAMEMLEGVAAAMMKATGQRALSTDHGTAFPVTGTSVRCTDAEAFRAWAQANAAWHFFTNNVVKDEVLAYMEKNEGRPPPGLTVDGYVSIQFRKS